MVFKHHFISFQNHTHYEQQKGVVNPQMLPPYPFVIQEQSL